MQTNAFFILKLFFFEKVELFFIKMMLFLLTDNGVSITILKRINTFKKCLTFLILISSRQILVVIAHKNQKLSGNPQQF